MRHSIAIIGGGLAGLTATTYFAHAGHDVIVFEQSTDYGGRARTQEYDKFYFNQGLHASCLVTQGVQILSTMTGFLQNSRLKEKSGTYEETKKMISNSNSNLLVLGHTEL